MFFYLSKAFEYFASPANVLGLCVVVAAIGFFTGLRGVGWRALGLAVVLCLVFAWGPGGALLVLPLENRFPRPAANMPAPEGIIVLGGAIEVEISNARHSLALDDTASRLTAAVALTRRFPQARLVFSGGSANVFGDKTPEADLARQLFLRLGVPADRMMFESRSRTTYENAIFTRDLIKPEPGARWLLVTSAFHMPRAMGIFEHIGFPVIAYPTGYMTRGDFSDFRLDPSNVNNNLHLSDYGVHEWLGLLAYRLTGRTGALFPSP